MSDTQFIILMISIGALVVAFIVLSIMSIKIMTDNISNETYHADEAYDDCPECKGSGIKEEKDSERECPCRLRIL